ncbi:MAG: DUF1080 domain-containing protein [Verrucomicrobia bacterium]|nr:DUF1080 domain-containing protein [Verrucomicrobiota bacterium]
MPLRSWLTDKRLSVGGVLVGSAAMLRFMAGFLVAAAAGAMSAAELQFDFGTFETDKTPPGFRSSVSGSGKPGDWKIILDAVPPQIAPITPDAPVVTKRPVLAQLDRSPTDEHFPLLIYEKETFSDFTLTTRFKTVSGAIEQMAGVAFRLQDEKNYYYFRASSLGNTFRFYKLVNGERSAPIGADVPIPKGVWHDLSITCQGNSIRCLLDGKEVIPALTDNTFATGKIAFWTKSDSVSYFADVKINYKPRIPLAQTMVNDLFRSHPRLVGLKVFAPAGKESKLQIIASLDEKEIGQSGRKVEEDVLAKSAVYYGKEKDSVLVTMPLHDRNGDTVAAVRVTMKSFPGQTEQNAIARALPIVKEMEARVRSAKEMFE